MINKSTKSVTVDLIEVMLIGKIAAEKCDGDEIGSYKTKNASSCCKKQDEAISSTVPPAIPVYAGTLAAFNGADAARLISASTRQR